MCRWWWIAASAAPMGRWRHFRDCVTAAVLIASSSVIVTAAPESDYEVRNQFSTLVDIRRVKWETDSRTFKVGTKRVTMPVAVAMPADAPIRSVSLKGRVVQSCLLSFDIEKRKRLPWVKIDEIRVRLLYFRAPK